MDWDKVKTILDVMHSAATAGPKYAWLAAAADAALEEVKAYIERPPQPPLALKSDNGAKS